MLLVLETDSIEVYNWLNQAGNESSSHKNLTAECHELLTWNWRIDTKHVFQEMNKTVDRLA